MAHHHHHGNGADHQQQHQADAPGPAARAGAGAVLAFAEGVFHIRQIAAGGVQQAGVTQQIARTRLVVGMHDPDGGLRLGVALFQVAELATALALVGAAIAEADLDARIAQEIGHAFGGFDTLTAEDLAHGAKRRWVRNRWRHCGAGSR